MQTIFFNDFNSLDRIRISPTSPSCAYCILIACEIDREYSYRRRLTNKNNNNNNKKLKSSGVTYPNLFLVALSCSDDATENSLINPAPNPDPLEDAYDTQQLIINESAAKKKTVFLFCVCTNIQNRRRNQPL